MMMAEKPSSQFTGRRNNAMESTQSCSILSGSAAELIRKFKLGRSARYGVAAVFAAVLASSVPFVQAQPQIWEGAGTDNNWSTAGNFNPGAPTTFDDLIFAGSTRTNPNNDLPDLYNSITFASNAGSFTLSGLDLAIDAGGITNLSSNLQIISFVSTTPGVAGINLTSINGDTQVWNAAAGDILITSDIAFLAPISLIITGAHNITITGSIADNGVPTPSSLTKEGTGTLTLTGRNTYPGDTIINGGTLIVDGSTESLNTYVNKEGTLGGIGKVGAALGTVYNHGNVAPGNSPGTLTIGGNYVQYKDGKLTIEIASKKSHDLLAVNGHADLDGTLRLVNTGKPANLKRGDKITILTAEEGVDGKFAKVVNDLETDTIIEPEVVYHENSVVVEGAQGSFKKFASKFRLTVNQRAVAGGLDKIAFRTHVPQVIRYLDTRQLVDLPGDFDRIAPDELASTFSVGVSLANVQSANLQRRTADLRAGSNGFSAAGYHTAGSGPSYSGGFGVAGPTGSESKDKKVFVPTEENRVGVFLTGVGEWVDVDGDGNARGYDITTGGFTLGIDYKLTPKLAIGVSAGYAGTGVDLNHGGRVFVNGGKLGLYGTYFDGGFYVDGAVNGGYNSYDTRRSALRGDARGSTDGGEVNALIGTGYDWTVGALTIGPTANFQYTYVGIDDYTEHGSIAPLNIESQGAESARTQLGLKASVDCHVGSVIIKPELRLAWQHEFADTSYDVASSFAGSSNSSFTVRGPEIGRDSMLVGAGVAVMLNERTSTYVYYDGELFRENYQSHNVSGGIRLSF